VLSEGEIGSLERGKKADLVVMDFLSVHTVPCHDLIASIVSSCRSENIESVLCNGSWLMFDRETLFDENFLLKMAGKQARELIQKAKITIPQRFKIIV
jgi:5-methylthioadenosine/S-adenosylhomocysteine deaminase